MTERMNESLVHRKPGCTRIHVESRASALCRCFYGSPNTDVHGCRPQILIDLGSEGAPSGYILLAPLHS